MNSFTDIKFGDVATEIIKWAKRLNANFHCQVYPVYCKKCSTKPTVWSIWSKKMLSGQKFASRTKVQSVVRQWLGQQPASFFASGIQKLVDIWSKCLKELERNAEK